MRNLYFIIFLLSFCCENKQILAQSTDTKTIPPAPNAASLGKYADIPISLYTGTPNISIPIYNVSEGNVSIPISLSYHAGGIKVEETPSRVGLGWALNCGGVITKTIRGLADEGSNGWLSYTTTAIPQSYDANNQYFENVAKGIYDSQPDVFYFNFAGRTGKIVFDQQNNPHIVPFQKIRVESSSSGWTLTTEDGSKYIFEKKEYSGSASFCNGNKSGNYTPYVSSWYLTEIIPSQSNNKILFEYEDNTNIFYKYRTIDSETKYEFLRYLSTSTNYAQNINKPTQRCETQIYITQPVVLKSITSSIAKVDFVKGAERCDLKGDYMLDQVIIRNKNSGDIIKKYKMGYKYFEGNSLWDISTACTPTNTFYDEINYSRRLMLMSLKELSGDELIQGQVHTFQYTLANLDGKGLPSRLSYNQDHWGFFNGSSNDEISTMIPASSTIGGAYREAELSSAKVGTLTRINYPTGGFTDFEYELHEVKNEGGLKMEKIEPKSAVLDIRPHLQTFGRVEVSPTFEVNSYTGSAKVTIIPGFPLNCSALICSGLSYNPHCQDFYDFMIYKYNGLDSTFIGVYNTPDDYASSNLPTERILQNGIYKIVHRVKSGVYLTGGPCFPYTFNLKWFNSSINDLKTIGGLRIKKMTDQDGIAGKKIVKLYEYKGEGGISSGTVINVPEYRHDYNETYAIQVNIGGSSQLVNTSIDYNVYNSSSNQPLMTTQGYQVGYKQVTVYLGEDLTNNNIGINGKIVYIYNGVYDFPDLLSSTTSSEIDSYSIKSGFPFAPIDSRDWLRGSLLEEQDYIKTGSEFFLVKKIQNTYNSCKNLSNPNYFELSAWKVGIRAMGFIATDNGGQLSIGNQSYGLLAAKFKVRSGYQELASTVTTIYDQNDLTKSLSTNTTYQYSLNHLQLIQKEDKLSDGSLQKTVFTYPSDFSSATETDTDWASSAIAKMKNQNRIKDVIEVKIWKKKLNVSDYYLIGGNLTKFKEYYPTKIYPTQQFQYYSDISVINPINTQISGGILQFDQSRYKRIMTLDNYNSTGKIGSYQKEDDVPTIYLWGYSNNYPIAEIKNATLENVQKALGNGNTTDGQNIINSIANSITLSEPQLTQINNLRTNSTYLKNAMVNTFTYQPLVGMRTAMNANGVISFYEYDGLNRLKYIRDQDGNIIKEYTYHFTEQQN